MKRISPLALSLALCLSGAGPATASTARLELSSNGHYMTEAMIDGASILVMVDTGASSVALSYEDAQRVGVRESDLSFNAPVSTANGTVNAAPVMIRRITIGGVSVEDVSAMVLPPGAMSGSLLGMSFLSRLDSYEVRQGVLILRD